MSTQELRLVRLLDAARDDAQARAPEDDALFAALRESLADDRSDAQLAALEAKLVAEIAPEPSAPGSSEAAAGAGARAGHGALAWNVGAGLLVLVAGAWLGQRALHTEARREAMQRAPVAVSARRADEASAPAVPALPANAAAKPVGEVVVGEVVVDEAREPSARRARVTRTESVARAEGLPASELEILRHAQAALRSEPLRALALTAEHRRAYARGQLEQEREVLAIEALLALGRDHEATARAQRFVRDFASSALVGRVQRMLQKRAGAKN